MVSIFPVSCPARTQCTSTEPASSSSLWLNWGRVRTPDFADHPTLNFIIDSRLIRLEYCPQAPIKKGLLAMILPMHGVLSVSIRESTVRQLRTKYGCAMDMAESCLTNPGAASESKCCPPDCLPGPTSLFHKKSCMTPGYCHLRSNSRLCKIQSVHLQAKRKTGPLVGSLTSAGINVIRRGCRQWGYLHVRVDVVFYSGTFG